MKRSSVLAGLFVFSSAAFAQVATFTAGAPIQTNVPGGATFSNSPTSVGVSSAGTISFGGSNSNTFTVNPVVGSFNRFDISVSSTATTTSNGGSQTAGVGVSGSGSVSHSVGTAATNSWNDRFVGAAGSAFTLTASGSGSKGTANSSLSISGVVAPLATGSITAASLASAGSPVVSQLSSPTLWVFDFPGNPGTGTATINLGNTSASFARAFNGEGLASLHRDNVRLEVVAFLNGIQVGSTQVSTANTTLAPLAGTGSNSIAFNSIPSITLNVGDIYAQTKTLTIETKLIGTAFRGNATSLGDYTIASSMSAPVTIQGVPEPASIAGLSLGLLAIARRRKSK